MGASKLQMLALLTVLARFCFLPGAGVVPEQKTTARNQEVEVTYSRTTAVALPYEF